MQNNAKAEACEPDAERDRFLQVLTLEYETLRAEILARLSARYQFIGFITAATALIGVAIGYSSGFKVWLLTAMAIIVLATGFYGYYRMVVQGRIVSARVAQIEARINKLVPVEPGAPNLLSWESEHPRESLLSPLLSDYRQLAMQIKSAKSMFVRSGSDKG